MDSRETEKSLCSEVLESLHGHTHFELVDWQFKAFDDLMGYHGDHKILTIRYKLNGRETSGTFFFKGAKTNAQVFEGYFSKIRCFEKEYHMLETVIEDLQKRIGEKLTARCYSKRMNEYIVLEDMGARGYRSAVDPTAWDHVSCAVEKLATLHAASILIECASGRSIRDTYPQIDFETFHNDTGEDCGILTKAISNVLECLVKERMREIPSCDKDAYLGWLKSVTLDLSKPSCKYRNVVCHGDPWPSNFMYKYDTDGRVRDVVIVDFQVSRIAPPALEIQQFIELTFGDNFTLKSTVRPKIHDAYYKYLTEILNKFSVDVEKIMPRKTFDESLSFYEKFGKSSNVFYSVITHLPARHMKRVDTPEKFLTLMTVGDTQLCLDAFDNDKKYREYCSNTFIEAYRTFISEK